MAFIDQLTPLVPHVTFFLKQQNLQIESTHQFEKQWLDSIHQIHLIADKNHLSLQVLSCSFSQLEKTLFSSCVFKPTIKRD